MSARVPPASLGLPTAGTISTGIRLLSSAACSYRLIEARTARRRDGTANRPMITSLTAQTVSNRKGSQLSSGIQILRSATVAPGEDPAMQTAHRETVCPDVDDLVLALVENDPARPNRCSGRKDEARGDRARDSDSGCVEPLDRSQRTADRHLAPEEVGRVPAPPADDHALEAFLLHRIRLREDGRDDGHGHVGDGEPPHQGIGGRYAHLQLERLTGLVRTPDPDITRSEHFRPSEVPARHPYPHEVDCGRTPVVDNRLPV